MTHPTIASMLQADAERLGLPLRTLEQVRAGLNAAKKNGADVSLARLMLRAGRLTDESRAYVEREYPQ